MDINIIKTIENLLNKNKIIETKLLSNSFNINCLKVIIADNKKFVVKFYEKKNEEFNAITAETKNLIFFNDKKINLFPKVINYDENFLIMEYFDHNKKKNKLNREFFYQLIYLHSQTSKKFGFYFDTQIGGMRQPNKFDLNWARFFGEKRLNVIFETICKTNPLPSKINRKIEKLILILKRKI